MAVEEMGRANRPGSEGAELPDREAAASEPDPKHLIKSIPHQMMEARWRTCCSVSDIVKTIRLYRENI